MEGNTTGQLYIELPFSELYSYPLNQNFLTLMREISDGVLESNDPQQQIKCIKELRRMRKHHRDLFYVTFLNIRENFENRIMLSDNSEVVYNSLILVTEIFSVYDLDDPDIQKIAGHLLKTVLEITGVPHPQIYHQCLTCLYLSSHNMIYEEVFYELLKKIADSNEKISQISTETSLTFILHIDSVYFQNNFDWVNITNLILQILQIPQDSYQSRLSHLLFFIRNSIFEDNFENLILGNLNTNEERTQIHQLSMTGNFIFEDIFKIRLFDENLKYKIYDENGNMLSY